MSIRKEHSKDDLARISKDITGAPMFIEVVNEVKNGFIHTAFNMKSTPEERTMAAHQMNGIDLVIARLDEFVKEQILDKAHEEATEANKDLHTN